MPEGINQVKYKISNKESFIPYDGCIDVYNANESDLREENLVEYQMTYGFVENERTAVDIATIVFHEIYQDCYKKEAPFIVKYNEKAEAWIVHGSLPFIALGGVASIGIKKDTGEILFLIHTK